MIKENNWLANFSNNKFHFAANGRHNEAASDSYSIPKNSMLKDDPKKKSFLNTFEFSKKIIMMLRFPKQ